MLIIAHFLIWRKVETRVHSITFLKTFSMFQFKAIRSRKRDGSGLLHSEKSPKIEYLSWALEMHAHCSNTLLSFFEFSVNTYGQLTIVSNDVATQLTVDFIQSSQRDSRTRSVFKSIGRTGLRVLHQCQVSSYSAKLHKIIIKWIEQCPHVRVCIFVCE